MTGGSEGNVHLSRLEHVHAGDLHFALSALQVHRELGGKLGAFGGIQKIPHFQLLHRGEHASEGHIVLDVTHGYSVGKALEKRVVASFHAHREFGGDGLVVRNGDT